MDETRAPVLDPGRGRTKTGYLLAVLRDDRGHGGADPPIVVYQYAAARTPNKSLKDPTASFKWMDAGAIIDWRGRGEGAALRCGLRGVGATAGARLSPPRQACEEVDER